MPTIGYLEGTDPLVLTKLAVKGIGTYPLSNGFDMHGKNIFLLKKEDGIDLVIGYLHKILPTPGLTLTIHDLLYSCLALNIPVLLIAPKEDHEAAKKHVKQFGDLVQLVDPRELYETIFWKLS
jgi:hypothetical protein